ncbi:MAG: hypothetical protein MZV63_03150 [Marinilabiliales bacterium]|nr:hypothetical protein [Marinilabiliales bacterium]
MKKLKKRYRKKRPEPEPFVVVEEMPMFPGGDAELLKYIGEHTQYILKLQRKTTSRAGLSLDSALPPKVV